MLSDDRSREEERSVRISNARTRGQGLVEYGLIIFLIAIVVIAALTLLGSPIGAVFSGISDAI